jgi:LPXTG-motif cell wall-anchored protein
MDSTNLLDSILATGLGIYGAKQDASTNRANAAAAAAASQANTAQTNSKTTLWVMAGVAAVGLAVLGLLVFRRK